MSKPRWYWLDDGKVIPAPDGSYLQDADNRRIDFTALGEGDADPSVSTVFLGLDHRYGDGPPLVFETMVFWIGHELDNECDRYSTLDEAKAGHLAMVERVQAALAEVTLG